MALKRLPAGAWLLTQLREEVRCTAPDSWEACLQKLEDAAKGGAWVALAAHYELGYAIEPRLRPLLPADHGPLVTGWIFEHGEWLDDDACEAWLAARAGSDVGGTGRMQAAISEADYLQQVERIRRYIAAGDCYQVNLTFPLDGEAFGNPARLYQALRAAQPVRYGAFIAHAGGAILSRSPELFLERQGQRLASRPMKGTAPRHTDPAALAASEKDRAENVMIVDLIRNDMGRLAPPGGVRVEDLCRIEAYPTVWQMTSRVVAEPVPGEFLRHVLQKTFRRNAGPFRKHALQVMRAHMHRIGNFFETRLPSRVTANKPDRLSNDAVVTRLLHQIKHALYSGIQEWRSRKTPWPAPYRRGPEHTRQPYASQWVHPERHSPRRYRTTGSERSPSAPKPRLRRQSV